VPLACLCIFVDGLVKLQLDGVGSALFKSIKTKAKFVRKIHTRIPVLPEEHHDAWLSGEAGKEIFLQWVFAKPAPSLNRMARQSEMPARQLA
jgi:hypothetical protein